MRRIMEMAGTWCLKHKAILLYLFFGVCTTIINMVCYYALYQYCHVSNIASTVIAWVAAVMFAFVTNKYFVFNSHRQKLSARLYELASFFGCRIMTGFLDIAIMVIAVDLLQWNSLLWKLISNILVTVINYIASKFLIFKGP